MKLKYLICAALMLQTLPAVAQEMTLEEAVALAREQSVLALRAKSAFISDYWAWRSYQASRLPSLSLYGQIGSFDRSLKLLQNYETGELLYTSNYNMQNSLGLRARQNITFTGGTLSLFSDLRRIDQFGGNRSTNWYSQPISLSYNQPLFAYNQFKWDKLISPQEYERARRTYLETMETVTQRAASYYHTLMLASRSHQMAKENYDNTSRMLKVSRERLALGSVTRDEYLQLELRMLNDSISINDSQVSLQQARMTFNSFLGLDESFEVQPVLDEELPDVAMDYEFVLEKCLGNSSFQLENSINILNAESSIERAKASRGITMQLSATFGLSQSSQDLPSVYRNLPDQEVVGLSFSVPIFDWGEGKGKVRKAEAAAEVVRAQVAQAENDKRIALFTAVGQFNNQRRLCDVSRRAADIAAERYRLIMDKFSGGTATVTDLNTARSESDEAARKYIGDIRDFWDYYYSLRGLTLYDFVRGEDISVSFDELID